MTNVRVTSSRKITIGLVLSWIFGTLFGLIGIISVFFDPIPGISMLIMATVLLPPVNKLVDEKWKFQFSGGMKIILVIIGFIFFVSTTDTSNQQDSQPQIQQEQEQSVSSDDQQEDETKPVEDQSGIINNEEPIDTEKTEIIPTSSEEKAETLKDKPTLVTSETISQKNAVRKAKSYLDYTAFVNSKLNPNTSW